MTGRKRKPGIARTASGRPSRAKAAYQENLEPILTRMRIFGLSEADARDQKAGTLIGRLNLQKIIDQQQYDAAVEYLRIYEQYKRAIKSPDALRTGSGGGDQGQGADYERWCGNAVSKFTAATNAVMAEQSLHANRGTNMFAAIDYILTRDEQMWHMVGDCRLALNALAHHFGIAIKVRSASAAA